MFDYIQAGVPVLVSNLPEMRRIVEHYRIGAIAETHQRKDLAEKMTAVLGDSEKNALWKTNLQIAARELCWEKEEGVLREIYSPWL